MAHPAQRRIIPRLKNQRKLCGKRRFGREVIKDGDALIWSEEEIRVHDLTAIRQVGHVVCGGDDDAEVEARTAHAPEQIAVLSRARRDTVAIGSDHSDAFQRIHKHTMEAVVPSHAATQGGSDGADARLGSNSYMCERG